MSFIIIEQKTCPVTGENFNTGNESSVITFGKFAENQYICTGYEYSKEVREKMDEGYMPFIVIDEEKSKSEEPEDVWRTGKIAFILSEVIKEVFGKEQADADFAFTSKEGLLEILKKVRK